MSFQCRKCGSNDISSNANYIWFKDIGHDVAQGHAVAKLQISGTPVRVEIKRKWPGYQTHIDTNKTLLTYAQQGIVKDVEQLLISIINYNH